MLVTAARYRTITGDTTVSPDDALAEATELLEEELRRPLEQAERTERMVPDSCGRLYPLATPIISVEGGYTIDGQTIFGGPFPTGPSFITGLDSVEVTYVGGYDEPTGNSSASNRLPRYVERDIAWAAYSILHPDAARTVAQLPTGGQIRLGDASISTPAGGIAAGTVGVTWSRQTLRLRRRFL